MVIDLSFCQCVYWHRTRSPSQSHGNKGFLLLIRNQSSSWTPCMCHLRRNRTDGHGQPIYRTSVATARAAATSTCVPMAATWIAATLTGSLVPPCWWHVSAEFIITGMCSGCGDVASDVLWVHWYRHVLGAMHLGSLVPPSCGEKA